ncbi:alpha/beta fold hydrolase [Undibacterium sp. Ren11W]|uniref:alpha/beta fold hydrolase n=1 Tax=Undibacterium sp. Ren11W TaxID=3413045 RepID=UPI003BF27A8C
MTKPLVNLILITATAVCASSAFSDPVIDAAIQNTFSHAQQMVDIGGRRLNLYCSGVGTHTVIFDAPSGDSGWSWLTVQPEVAKLSRACVYDRAGLGFSDPAIRPGTSENAVEDLHTLLSNAGIQPPYIMVGNSYGGANVQLYAYRYPDQVSGLVLVEAGHEDESARQNVVTKGKLAQFYAMINAIEKTCVTQAEQGFKPGSEPLATCMAGMGSDYGRQLDAAQFAVRISPDYWRARASESSQFELSDAQLRAARRSFGSLPLVVLSRGISPYAEPGKPQSALNKASENENLALHKEMAGLSTRGVHRVVAGAGHVIQASHPEAVVNAVAEVLSQTQH